MYEALATALYITVIDMAMLKQSNKCYLISGYHSRLYCPLFELFLDKNSLHGPGRLADKKQFLNHFDNYCTRLLKNRDHHKQVIQYQK